MLPAEILLNKEAVVGVSNGFADSFGTGAPVASVIGDLLVLNMNKGA